MCKWHPQWVLVAQCDSKVGQFARVLLHHLICQQYLVELYHISYSHWVGHQATTLDTYWGCQTIGAQILSNHLSLCQVVGRHHQGSHRSTITNHLIDEEECW